MRTWSKKLVTLLAYFWLLGFGDGLADPSVHPNAFNLVNSGLDDFARGHYDTAQSKFEEAARISTNYADAYYLMGITEHHKGAAASIDYIKTSYRKYIELETMVNDEEVFGSVRKASWVLHSLGDVEGLLHGLRKLVVANSTHPDDAYNFVVMLSQQGDEQLLLEATRHMQPLIQATKSDEKRLELLLLSGSLHRRVQQYEAAESVLLKAIELSPGDKRAYMNLGVVLGQAPGRAGDSISYYRRALALDPAYAMAVTNLESLLQRLGRLEEAAQVLEAYCEAAGKDDLPLLVRLATAYLSLAQSRSRGIVQDTGTELTLERERRSFLGKGAVWLARANQLVADDDPCSKAQLALLRGAYFRAESRFSQAISAFREGLTHCSGPVASVLQSPSSLPHSSTSSLSIDGPSSSQPLCEESLFRVQLLSNLASAYEARNSGLQDVEAGAMAFAEGWVVEFDLPPHCLIPSFGMFHFGTVQQAATWASLRTARWCLDQVIARAVNGLPEFGFKDSLSSRRTLAINNPLLNVPILRSCASNFLPQLGGLYEDSALKPLLVPLPEWRDEHRALGYARVEQLLLRGAHVGGQTAWDGWLSTLPKHLGDPARAALSESRVFNHSRVFQRPQSCRVKSGKWVFSDRPMRVGFIANEFTIQHPVCNLVKGLFHTERWEGGVNVELIAYSNGVKLLGGGVDACEDFIRARANRFVDIIGVPDATVAKMIYDDEIDVLVNIIGHFALDKQNPQTHRLQVMALHPAPVQIHYLSWPLTTGYPGFDYYVSDRIAMPPELQRIHTEALIRMPYSYWLQAWPDIPAVHRVPRKERDVPPSVCAPPHVLQEVSRVGGEKGLQTQDGCVQPGDPEAGIVFATFHQAYKIEPDVFTTWLHILERFPKSVLWLFSLSEPNRQLIIAEAGSMGLDPSRFVFADFVETREEHLARLREADVALDVFLPVNGMSTTGDAVSVGVPVVTCPQQSHGARAAASILIGCGRPELVASSTKEYEDLAITSASEAARGRLARTTQPSARLGGEGVWRGHEMPVFDWRAFDDALEHSMAHAFERFLRGLDPYHMDAAMAVREQINPI